MGFATNAIHVGQEPDPATGAIVAPIYQTSTYINEELGKNKGYDYARTNHPNRKALERTVAKLEGGHSAYVFSSGLSVRAITWSFQKRSTAAYSASPHSSSCTSAWNSASWTLPRRISCARRCVQIRK